MHKKWKKLSPAVVWKWKTNTVALTPAAPCNNVCLFTKPKTTGPHFWRTRQISLCKERRSGLLLFAELSPGGQIINCEWNRATTLRIALYNSCGHMEGRGASFYLWRSADQWDWISFSHFISITKTSVQEFTVQNLLVSNYSIQHI